MNVVKLMHIAECIDSEMNIAHACRAIETSEFFETKPDDYKIIALRTISAVHHQRLEIAMCCPELVFVANESTPADILTKMDMTLSTKIHEIINPVFMNMPLGERNALTFEDGQQMVAICTKYLNDVIRDEIAAGRTKNNSVVRRPRDMVQKAIPTANNFRKNDMLREVMAQTAHILNPANIKDQTYQNVIDSILAENHV